MSIGTLLSLLPLALGLGFLIVCEILNRRFRKNVIEPADKEFLRKRAELRKNKIAYEEMFECKYPRESMGRAMCSRECEHFDRLWGWKCELRGGNR